MFSNGMRHALIGFLNKKDQLIYGDARSGKLIDLSTDTIIERIIA